MTKRLNTDFWDTTSDTAHSLYVGSCGRNTAIEGLSDLDGPQIAEDVLRDFVLLAGVGS